MKTFHRTWNIFSLFFFSFCLGEVACGRMIEGRNSKGGDISDTIISVLGNQRNSRG